MSDIGELTKPLLQRIREASPQTRDAKIFAIVQTCFVALLTFVGSVLVEEFKLVLKQFLIDLASQIAEVPILFGISLASTLMLIAVFMSRQEMSYKLARMKPEDFVFVRSRLVSYVNGAWSAEIAVMNNHPDDAVSITCNELVLWREKTTYKGLSEGLSTVKIQPKSSHVFRFNIPCANEQFSAALQYTVHVNDKALPRFEDEVMRLVRVSG